MKKDLSMPQALVLSTLIICITFFVTTALFFNEKNRSPKMMTPSEKIQQNKERAKIPQRPTPPVSATSSTQ